MTRSALAVAVLLAATGNAFAQSTDTPPTKPGNFRATLYDKAGGELFWQRSTDDRGAVRGYEITRNGESLGVRDALSFYDPSLQPGVPYTFTVVAIDNAGQRSSVATTTLGGGTAPPFSGDGPDAPDALRSEVYSRTAAELFWQREPAALALRYEIRRDGQVVGTTDGVSYYTRDLAAGTEYDFEVIAIDRDGRRSTPSRIELTTAGSSDTGGSVVSAPSGLRAEVYSARNGELFWDRSDTVGLRYEVRRDGMTVATTNGVSYYDDMLLAGTTYTYEVITINRQGRRSEAALVDLATPGGNDGSDGADTILNVDQREAILTYLFDVTNGTIYGEALLQAERLLDGEYLATLLESGIDPDTEENTALVECDQGGTIATRGQSGAQVVNRSIEISDCRFEDTTFNGAASTRSFGGRDSDTDYEELSIDSGSVRQQITGGRGFSASPAFEFFSFGVERYEFTNGTERTLITDAGSSTRKSDIGQPFVTNARATIEASWTRGETVTVETTKEFRTSDGLRPDDGRYDTGTLVARASDGSVFTIEADNGEASSFQLTVEANGATSAFTIPWSATAGLLPPNACGLSPSESNCGLMLP